MKDPADWLLTIALLGLLPILALQATDLWFRTDLQFFPALIALSVGLVVRYRRFGNHTSLTRRRRSLLLLAISAAAALASALLISPWFGCLATTLSLLAWMLRRLENPGHQLVAWLSPILLLLTFPLSDGGDWSVALRGRVVASSSALLDLLGIPQLPRVASLELQSGVAAADTVVHGISNIYLLVSLTVAMTLLLGRSLLISMLTVAAVPLWSWAGAVLQLTCSAYLHEAYRIYLFGGYRLWVVQSLVLILQLVSLAYFQKGLLALLSPFKGYSMTAGPFHALFDWATTWPGKSPHAHRHERSPKRRKSRQSQSGQGTSARVLLISCGVVFLVAGGMTAREVFFGNAASRLLPLSLPPTASIEQLLRRETLPAEFSDMSLIGYSFTGNPSTSLAGAFSATWSYNQEGEDVAITIELPFRGLYPVEHTYMQAAGRLLSVPRQHQIASSILGQIAMTELELNDPIYGLSLLCYAHFPMHTGLSRPTQSTTEPPKLNSIVQQHPFSLQPTVANIRLFIQGIETLPEDELARYRRILVAAIERFAPVLKEF
jgi:hypothetical protein